MPKLRYSEPVEAVSGTLRDYYRAGGATVYHSAKSSNTLRNWVTPYNPRAPFQRQLRTNMGMIAAEWTALSADDRATWNAYAENIERLDPLGQPYTLNGFQAFSSLNNYAHLNAINVSLPGAYSPNIQQFPPLVETGTGAITNTADISDKTITIKSEFPVGTTWSGKVFFLFSTTPLGNSNGRRVACRLFDLDTTAHFESVNLVPGVNTITYTFATSPFSAPGSIYICMYTVCLSSVYLPGPPAFSTRNLLVVSA